MKFTKGLFIGTALGISAAMMMNNKLTNNNNAASNTNNNYKNNANPYSNINNTVGAAAQTDAQSNDYIENDII
jgi:hypothetical protein